MIYFDDDMYGTVGFFMVTRLSSCIPVKLMPHNERSEPQRSFRVFHFSNVAKFLKENQATQVVFFTYISRSGITYVVLCFEIARLKSDSTDCKD